MDKFKFVLLLLLLQALYIVSVKHHRIIEATEIDVAGIHNDKELVFFADRATKASYTDFITELRNQLRTSVDSASGMEVLPDPATLPVRDRYFEVEIASGEKSVTLGIDRINLFAAGYRVRRQSYFFDDTYESAHAHLFVGTNQTRLCFSSGYPALGGRQHVYLGFRNLQNAISVINTNSNAYHHRSHLVVIIQMVSEAGRSYYIEEFFRQLIRDDGYRSMLPSTTMIELEDKWQDISGRVQEAEYGVFHTPVNITNTKGLVASLTTVRQVILEIAVMIFVCTRPSTMVMANYYYNNSNYLRMVTLKDAKCMEVEMSVNIVGGDGMCVDYCNNNNNYLRMLSLMDSTCTEVEMSVNIVGRDGMCVDVRDGQTDNGNPLVLWPCHSRRNQKWTLMKDGTIRSMGKCMTVYGFRSGSHMMIHNCDTADKDATRWNIWPNGTIVSANHPSLVLTATDGKGTTLTVEKNKYAAIQGWSPNTNVKPFVVSIIGYNDLCLQASDAELTRVWVDECSRNSKNQLWAIYGDGSIRKNDYQDLCLTSDGHTSGDTIIIRKCSGWDNQRWVFQADGTILNPVSGLVMDIKQSDPDLRQIIIYRPTLKPNQKWLHSF